MPVPPIKSVLTSSRRQKASAPQLAPSVSFQKHINISSPSILADPFVERLLDVLGSNNMSFLSYLFKLRKDIILFLFAQTAMIPSGILASHELFAMCVLRSFLSCALSMPKQENAPHALKYLPPFRAGQLAAFFSTRFSTNISLDLLNTPKTEESISNMHSISLMDL